MRLSSRDISHREIGILEGKRIETFQVSKHREDLDRPLAETRGGDRASVGILVIGKSEFPRSKETRLQNSRNPGGIGTVHLEGTRGNHWRHRESPDREADHRCLVHRVIGDPGDKLFAHFGITKRVTPISGEQFSAHQAEERAIVEASCQCSGDSRIRGVGNPTGVCILASQTPKPRRGLRLWPRGDSHVDQG
jgi:hypothetical protein